MACHLPQICGLYTRTCIPIQAEIASLDFGRAYSARFRVIWDLLHPRIADSGGVTGRGV